MAVLFCHGNAGNITHRAGALEMLHNRVGVSVLIFDYRGYGRSEGSPDGEQHPGRRPRRPGVAGRPREGLPSGTWC